MERREFARQFQRFLNKYDRFVISGHMRPDGDSVGACATIAYYLESVGKEAVICFDGDASRYTNVLAPLKTIPTDMKVEQAGSLFESGTSFAFIMVDCWTPERTGRCEPALMKAEASLTIDHHATCGAESTDFAYCEPDSSSASEVIYHLLKLCEMPITLDMATAMFMGLVFDTGGMRHSNTSAESYLMAADLKTIGVDNTAMMNYLLYQKPINQMRAMAGAVRRSKMVGIPAADGRVVKVLFSLMGQLDFQRLGISPKDADGVAGFLGEVEEADTICYLREIEDDQVRVNMRSKEILDVAKTASCFGGGGHVRAAGCTFSGQSLQAAKKSLISAFERQLGAAEGSAYELSGDEER